MNLLPRGKRGWATFVGLCVLAVMLAAFAVIWMTSMPGQSFQGVPPPLTAYGRATAERMRAIVNHLSEEIGPRSPRDVDGLSEAADFIDATLTAFGYEVRRYPFQADSVEVVSLEAIHKGSPSGAGCFVVGAHYDSVWTSPGADDNASGVACLLELARRLRIREFTSEVRFVFFPNEEPPYFGTAQMGSVFYAASLQRQGVEVRGMISIDAVGYFSDTAGSQDYPFPFATLYPDQANFVAIVGNLQSRALVRSFVGAFRSVATVPSEGLAAPEGIPGVGWSDHASFWDIGVPAILVTDTVFFRSHHYHQPTDTGETLDYETMVRVVEGLEHALIELAGG